MTNNQRGYTVERYDSAWGGWRRVPESDTDDRPFRPFLRTTRGAALRRWSALNGAMPTRDHRVMEVRDAD